MPVHHRSCLNAAVLLSGLLLTVLSGVPCAVAQAPSTANDTFTNPLLPHGADPWVTQYKGTYYYTQTTGKDLTLWATQDMADLAHAAKRVVWTPSASGPASHDIWAPELHRLDGRWYLYFAADSGKNETHRLFVLENASDDPLQGSWQMKGQVADSTNKWAIDATVAEIAGQKYLLWAGWPGDVNGEQDIYIAHLKNPWTVDSERVRLSRPEYPWEQVGDLLSDPALPHVDVNEGPEILQHGNDIFLTYSASGCWTDYYALGLLRAKRGSNLLDPKSWTKLDHFVFRMDPAARVFGTGHNSFFKSPDGKQDWLLYHANDASGDGCGGRRSPRAQPFTWNASGLPVFGSPVSTGQALPKPSHTR